MARLHRVDPVGVPQHIIERGNNRQICFGLEQGLTAHVGWLKKYPAQYEVDIHAWGVMTNHAHLLCTPQMAGGISKMMQSIGRHLPKSCSHNPQQSPAALEVFASATRLFPLLRI